LKPEDVVIYDRGYLSYALIHEHYRLGIHAVFRLKTTQTFLAIQRFAKCNQNEKIVQIELTNRPTRKVMKQFPDMEIKPLPLRLIKYRIKGKVYLLGTTLLNTDRYPMGTFSTLYHSRWDIEELFKVSKRVVEIEDFHSKSERGVKQELFAHFLFLTLSRIFSNQANKSINEEKSKKNQREFSTSLRYQFQKLYKLPGSAVAKAFTLSR
jgi:IS4 transposase